MTLTEQIAAALTEDVVEDALGYAHAAFARNIILAALAPVLAQMEQENATLTAERDRARTVARDVLQQLHDQQAMDAPSPHEQEIASWPVK